MAVEGSRRTSLGGIPLSYLSLATLAVQNAALILVMHYSRIMPLKNGQRYYTSTAVFLNEVLKLAIALFVALYDTAGNMGPNITSAELVSTLYAQVFSADSWKLAIPAALYTFQNSLQYIAVSNLDAATFQVTYQLKILTTAIFSVTMLKRSLTVKKWISLVLLMAGVAIVQMPVGTGSTASKDKVAHPEMNKAMGMIAVFIACAISGLAGVYFEKVLKDSTQVTLWVRNVQLSFYSLFPALFIGVIFKDGANISRDGFFVGYNWVVWTAITFQACGGLLVALVVNYADNIAKNFATSISIIISFFASVWLFDFAITPNFLAGMTVVLYATYLYSAPDRRPSSMPAEPDRGYQEPIAEIDEESTFYDSERTPALTEKGSR
ncbi:nucleotide-sugar transporter [Venturia nashicola]|uniref:Nucleotide-sugar transporter n=1 Tax=Venturia nashicola TaxID=86259 RepID=A0A4Z1NMI5_9PEZI|nr:nucleotide-sugar transporter [Venturia nashicola]TLD21770.1 nucleotide-sugar transporter [Venturia nashicola]